MEIKILICGGRNFANPVHFDNSTKNQIAINQYKFGMNKLNELILPLSIHSNPNDNWLPLDITIISGGAKGADQLGIDWAVVNYSNLSVYKANWRKYGRAAGFIRNQQMLDEGRPSLVIAFPGGTGTKDMIRRSKKAGIKVIEVEYDIQRSD